MTLNTATNVFGGGPVTVAGQVSPVNNMSAGVFIAGGVVTIHCNTTSATVAATDPLCG